MSEENVQLQQEQEAKTLEAQQNNKEYNFAQIRKQLEQERQARLAAEQQLEKLKQPASPKDDDDDDYDEPYVDRRYLKRNLAKTSSQIKEEAKQEAQQEMRRILYEEKRNAWLRSNPDFEEVMQHAQKFAEHDPELAETILEMPEGFERQKLVYKNIKALGLHKPKEKESSIQDKINQNRRSPYYQPTQMGAAPYGSSGDFSAAGQKNAYQQMKELQKRLGLR